MAFHEMNSNPDWGDDENVPPFDVDEDENSGPYDFSDVDSMENEPLVHEQTPDYDVAMAEEASREYVGQWSRLVSQTNWEKGRLISSWRESMIQSGVPNQLYSDEAWSRRVGNVTSQHVGRLRRVFERFGKVYEQYSGLFWSHFQAAIDWEDAEVWLEGASQQRWSVSGMRKQRWIAIGAPPELKPKDEEVILSELDEDVAAGFDSTTLSGATGSAQFPSPEQISRVQADGVVTGTARGIAGDSNRETQSNGEFGHGERKSHGNDEEFTDSNRSRDAVPPAVEDDIYGTPGSDEEQMKNSAVPERVFENLPPLPPDLDEAMEMFRLAILNHKLAKWAQVSKEDVLAVLEMLRKLCN